MTNNLTLRLFCLLFVGLILSACSSTGGPVIIRDSQEPVFSDPATGEERAGETQQQVVIAQPVVPDRQQATVPLIERLVVQANQQIANRNYDQAINLSERGLRINRKESRLYLTLAKAYSGLSNKQQSVYFAKQGLRYASKDGDVFTQLKRLSK